MNLVDSCGWLEYLADGPNADFYAGAIEKTKDLLVPSICIYEVFKSLYRQIGEDKALQAIALMEQGLVVDLNDSIAMSAAKISAVEKLPMADSIVLATGRKFNALIWTQDADFENISNVKFTKKK